MKPISKKQVKSLRRYPVEPRNDVACQRVIGRYGYLTHRVHQHTVKIKYQHGIRPQIMIFWFSLRLRKIAVVKTYYCEGFEQVAATCPVPIVLAGGKKLPELDALTMAYKAIDQGASGVDMGRNIFQAGDPIAMIQAVKAVVHDNETPEKAFDLYNTLKQEQK
jgi:hypothetical protein